ncbi:NepR family anti-sigma factor [Hyphobacterium sp.]|jgi:hypothetical protein|uniref:NepR family anti-sigma factor n=1 Tax=Hyphobacterium sp. TaxID=2004662 RepID=UPI003BA98D9D
MTRSKKKLKESADGKGVVRGTDSAKIIGNRLRQIYDDVANEPLPDEFIDLLSKLDDDGEGEKNAEQQ